MHISVKNVLLCACHLQTEKSVLTPVPNLTHCFGIHYLFSGYYKLIFFS